MDMKNKKDPLTKDIKKRRLSTTRQGGERETLTYDKLISFLLPNGFLKKKVDFLNDNELELRNDKRKPKINVGVSLQWDTRTFEMRSENDFNVCVDVEKRFEHVQWINDSRMIILSLTFNCDLVCRAHIPGLPQVLSETALENMLSMKVQSYLLGKLKIDSLSVLYSWIRQAAVLDVCGGIEIPEKWSSLTENYVLSGSVIVCDDPSSQKFYDANCLGLFCFDGQQKSRQV